MGYLLIYVGSYFSLLNPVDSPMIPVQVPLRGLVAVDTIVPGVDYWPIRPAVALAWRYPTFRDDDENVARRLFEPMISLDLRIRQDYWKIIRITPVQ
jgi:hypothetical protein